MGTQPAALEDHGKGSESAQGEDEHWQFLRSGTPSIHDFTSDAYGLHKDTDQSESSVQLSNLDESEFLVAGIAAYKKKKAQADKYKKRSLKLESELHLVVHKAKILDEQYKALKKKNRKTEQKCRQMMQIIARNEAEGLKKTLEIRTKERDLYKQEMESTKDAYKKLRD